MGTYRERRLARADRLDERAAGRAAKADAAHDASRAATAGIPFGQPILIGHHSQRRHENAIARARDAADASLEHGRKSAQMASAAEEIRAQADRAIYDDDPDAVERLTAKLAGLEAEREAVKAKRAELRKAGGAELRAMSAWEREEVMRAAGAAQYRVTNLGGQITQARDRLARLKREREHGPRDRMICARFTSECTACGATLEKGSTIRYNRQQGARCYPGCTSEEG